MLAHAVRFATVTLVALALGACSKDQRSEQTHTPASSAPVETPVVAPATTVTPVVDATVDKPLERFAAPKSVASAETKKPKVVGDGKFLQVKKLVIATDVEKGKREPQGVGSSFKKGEFEKIYAYVEVANPADESEVIVSFKPPSNKASKGKVHLTVGTSPRWRTWAFSKGLDETGEWTAIVTSPDGRELARETFEII